MISKPITMQTWERNDDLQPVRIMQGDAMSRILKITLASRGAPVDLTNTTVTAHFLRPGGLQSFLPADVTDAGAGLVQVTLTSQIAAVPGRVDLIIRAVKAEPVEVLFSGTARIEVMPNGVDDGAIVADNEFTALTVALSTVQEYDGRIGALETGKLDAAEKGVPGGVATLDPQTGKLQQTDGLLQTSDRGAAGGVAALPSTLPATGSLLQLGAGGTVQAATDASGTVVTNGDLPKIIRGDVSAPGAAGVRQAIPVTFPPGTFATVPDVLLNARTAQPALVHYTATEITKDGFTLYFVRDTDTSTGVAWVAIGR